MKNNIGWIIHLCANGNCDECGKREEGFLPYTCNAHTHGMEEYGHMDFQLVLKAHPAEIGRILNTSVYGCSPADDSKPAIWYRVFFRTAMFVWMNLRKQAARSCVSLFRMMRIAFLRMRNVWKYIVFSCWKQTNSGERTVQSREGYNLSNRSGTG